MSEDVPEELAVVLGRIVAPDPVTASVPPDITGALAGLLGWWQGLGASTIPRAVDVAVAEAGAAATAVLAGIAATDRAIDAGATLLVPRVGARDDVSARAVVGLLTRKEASAVVAQSPGMTDRDWMTVCAAVRDRMATASHLRGEPLALLDALGAGHLAGVVGVLLGASARRTPCLVDGTDELAAALVADRLSYTRAKGWWRAGSDSPDPGRHAAMDRIDITPGLPLGLSDDAGRGAQVTVAVLRMLTSDGASE